MKLLIVISFYPPHHIGGYELRCGEVVEGLRKRGHEVEVMTSRCPHPDCTLHLAEETVSRILNQKTKSEISLRQAIHDIHDLRCISSKLRAFDPDIIYVWHIENLSYTIFPYFSGQKRLIVLDDGSSEARFLNRLLRNGLYFFKNEKDSVLKYWIKKCGHLMVSLASFNLIRPWWSWPQNLSIYFGSAASLRFAADDGAPVGDAQVIHSGIDISQFPCVFRNSLGSPIRILVPGRIHPQKGTKDALRLAYELVNRDSEVKLLLIGSIQSPQYFDEIIETARKMKLNNVVEYHGLMSRVELARLYQENDVCFFPSYYPHGLSRVPLEAMSSGCLVISYGNEGSSEIIRDHETGFLISEGDVSSAAALIEDMVMYPMEFERITKRAREQVEQEHTLEAYVDKIETFLQESLLNSSRVPS